MTHVSLNTHIVAVCIGGIRNPMVKYRECYDEEVEQSANHGEYEEQYSACIPSIIELSTLFKQVIWMINI